MTGGGAGGTSNIGDKDLTVQARGVWEGLLSGHVANKKLRKASGGSREAGAYTRPLSSST